MRSNEYKQKICDVLEKHHLLSLANIHKNIPDAHFTSIYRNVESLCADKILKKVVISKNDIRYELTSHNHSHFVCEDCESISEMHIPAELLKNSNAKSISDVLVRGTCKDCVEE